MDPENTTPETLPEEGGEGAVEEVVEADDGETSAAEDKVQETPNKTPEDTLTLDEINAILGKDFKSKEVALKAIKDTQSYVGKKTQDVEKELKEKGYLSREDLENELFFRDNPEHAENKTLLEALAAKEGTTLKEAANSDAYKNIFEKALNYEKSESKKSVLNPSPRLKQAMERMDNIKELKQSGNIDAAQAEAARAVAEAFDIEI